jgi:hypothetical protein
MEVCTARQEVYSAGVEDRQYMKKRVVLLQIYSKYVQGGKLFISVVALLLSISRPTCCQHGEFHREYILHIPARRGGFHLKDKTGFLYYKTKPQKAKDTVGATGAAFPRKIPTVLILIHFP